MTGQYNCFIYVPLTFEYFSSTYSCYKIGVNCKTIQVIKQKLFFF